MGSRYLTDLAAVLRAYGLTVHEQDGWQNRARGSGGYEPGRPTHVMVHHTASGPSSDPYGDVSYITSGADAAPLANLYLSRTGQVWVIAAGATNTNGSGSDSWGGGVPVDSMNTHAIGIEAANAGTGEPWPQAQTDAYLTICRALCAAYSIPNPHHVRGHAEWSPGRKIDPAGPPRWADGSETWRMDDYRTDVALDEPTPPTPTPIPDPQEYDMAFMIRDRDTGAIGVVYGDGKLTGIDGTNLEQWTSAFGAWIDVDSNVFNDFATKGAV